MKQMNRYSKAFYTQVEKVTKALTHLNQLGCAITTLKIDDNGIVISILPPPGDSLKGSINTCIKGSHKGVTRTMSARVHGCNVVWNS